MSVSTETDAAPVAPALLIDGDMTIYRVGALKEQLLAALENAAGIECDLSGVAEIDGAGVQLLLFASRKARMAGKALRFVRPSAAVADACDLLNLAGPLEITTSSPEALADRSRS